MNTQYITGFQHIALPASDLEATIRFYEGLGFKTVHRTKDPAGTPVAFLRFGTCTIESYQVDKTAKVNGAWDHLALDVTDAAALLKEVEAAGCYKITTNGVEELPFWDKGIRFFKIEGPDKESIEFCEIVK